LLQIRGSIPIFWSQQPSLKYTPTCVIAENNNVHYQAFKKHMTTLVRKYEKLTLVNLVDKKGFQFRIGQKFEEMFDQFRSSFKHPKSLFYTWFDYHAQCKGMKVENCEKLMKDIHSQLKDYGWLEFEVYNGNFILINLISKMTLL
jgi:hypothetical protein